jgi:hypothetical protein
MYNAKIDNSRERNGCISYMLGERKYFGNNFNQIMDGKKGYYGNVYTQIFGKVR